MDKSKKFALLLIVIVSIGLLSFGLVAEYTDVVTTPEPTPTPTPFVETFAGITWEKSGYYYCSTINNFELRLSEYDYRYIKDCYNNRKSKEAEIGFGKRTKNLRTGDCSPFVPYTKEYDNVRFYVFDSNGKLKEYEHPYKLNASEFDNVIGYGFNITNYTGTVDVVKGTKAFAILINNKGETSVIR